MEDGNPFTVIEPLPLLGEGSVLEPPPWYWVLSLAARERRRGDFCDSTCVELGRRSVLESFRGGGRVLKHSALAFVQRSQGWSGWSSAALGRFGGLTQRSFWLLHRSHALRREFSGSMVRFDIPTTGETAETIFVTSFNSPVNVAASK